MNYTTAQLEALNAAIAAHEGLAAMIHKYHYTDNLNAIVDEFQFEFNLLEPKYPNITNWPQG
jgi:hypothetical protein